MGGGDTVGSFTASMCKPNLGGLGFAHSFFPIPMQVLLQRSSWHVLDGFVSVPLSWRSATLPRARLSLGADAAEAEQPVHLRLALRPRTRLDYLSAHIDEFESVLTCGDLAPSSSSDPRRSR